MELGIWEGVLPTILIESGFRIYFFANERSEPPHVHIQHGEGIAKFWLSPVALAKNRGLKSSDLKRAGDLVRKHEKVIRRKWDGFFGKKT